MGSQRLAPRETRQQAASETLPVPAVSGRVLKAEGIWGARAVALTPGGVREPILRVPVALQTPVRAASEARLALPMGEVA